MPVASPGIYIFRKCVPMGNFDIANIDVNNLFERGYSFAVNDPPELQSLIQTTFDPTNLIQGSDGEFYDVNAGTRFAEVNRWRAQVTINTGTYRPGGRKLEWRYITSYTVDLTFTETVHSDTNFLKPIMDSLRDGTCQFTFDFQGVVTTKDCT
jgi:hypothetical protein